MIILLHTFTAVKPRDRNEEWGSRAAVDLLMKQ